MSKPAKKSDRKYTYQDYLTWPVEERWEIIDGEAWAMTPAPSVKHQKIVGALFARLASFFQDGPCAVFVSPLDVVLDEANIVQPDVVLVCDEAKITEANIQGAPELVVEVVSPASRLMDKREKKRLYERFGVREYWIVYPEDELVDRFLLDRGRYSGPDTFNWDEKMPLMLFPEKEIYLWEIFGKALPPQDA